MNAAGQVTAVQYGNGLTSSRLYDAVTGLVEQIDTGSVQALRYYWDAVGNLEFRQDLLQGLSESFQYDAWNRLQTVSGPSPMSISSRGNLKAGLYGGLMSAVTAGYSNGAAVQPTLKQAMVRAGGAMVAAANPRLAAYTALAAGGIHAHGVQGWAGVGKFALKQGTDHLARREVAKVAARNGLSLMDVNLGLSALSALGNGLTGSRFDSDRNLMEGVNQRDLAGWAFDAVDVVLGFQGLPTASAVHYGWIGAGSDLVGHSLGALDVNNLASWGMTGTNTVASLPFRNAGTAGVAVMQGRRDLINFGKLSRLLTPDARIRAMDSIGHGRCTAYAGTAVAVGC